MTITPKAIVAGAVSALGLVGVVAATALAHSPNPSPAATPAGAVSLTADQHGQLTHLTQNAPTHQGDQAEAGESNHDADSAHEDNG